MSQPLIDRESVVKSISTIKDKLSIKHMDALVRASESNKVSAAGQTKCDMDYLVQASLRVWTDRGIGIAVTTDLSESGLLAAAKSAVEAGSITPPSEYEYHPGNGDSVSIIDINEPLINPKILQEDLTAAVTKVTAAHASVTMPFCQTSQTIVQRLYANSDGQSHYNAYIVSDAFFQARTMSDQDVARTALELKSTNRYADLNQSALAHEAARRAIDRKHHVKIETGNYAVVIGPNAMLSILGGFADMFSGQSVAENLSLLNADALGSLIASSLLTISDVPHSQHNTRPTWFSGEGERTEETTLIREGRLEHFLHSRLSAKLLRTTSNGHGSFGAKPECTPYFLSVAPCRDTTAPDGKTFFSGQPCVYVDRVHSLHAGIKARQGSFSLPFEGRLIKNGTEVSIEAAVVAGDFLSLLKNIAYVGPNAKVEDHGMCPEIGVPDLKVTGR